MAQQQPQQQQPQHQDQSPPFTIEINEGHYAKYGAVHDGLIEKLRGLSPESRELALQALMWLSCARRPLTAKELGYALASAEGATAKRLDRLDHSDAARQRAACSACASLVSEREERILVRRFRDQHDALNVVYNTKPSISLTAQVAEYFALTWECWFPHAHRDIAIACLGYLSLEAFATENPPTDKCEFYAYAAQNWGYHANIQPVQQSLIMDFLGNEKKIRACSQYLPLKRVCGCCILGRPKTFTKLHLPVYFGLYGTVQYLIEEGAEVDGKDDDGRTPLSWAVELGRSSIAKHLLNHGADANMPERIQNPLGWAVFNGDPGLFHMLIEYGARPGCAHPTRGDILLKAAIQGQEDLVRILIDQGVDCASFRDRHWGRSPISQAAEYGRENVVKLLLAHGIDPNSKDINGEQQSQKNDGKTPFTWAVKNGHMAVMNLLIRHGACPGPVNPTALVSAAIRGQHDLCRYLLEQNVPSTIHEPAFGRSPLSQAAEYGQVHVTKLLLTWRADPNMRDINGKNTTQNNEGKTPLMWACMNGRLSIVKLLLDRGADPNLQERDGRAALSWAAERGRVAVVQTLLQQDTDVNQPDTYRFQTPISWAAMNGHQDVVKLLLIHGADAFKKDQTGRTALSWAYAHSHQVVVQLLLELGLPRPCSLNSHEMTCSQCKPFEYTPLPGPTSIRLLSRVKNGGGKASTMGVPLPQYSVEIFDLKDDPTFEALSYTWGSPFPADSEKAREYNDDDQWPISVNGNLAFVRKNLYEFLQQGYLLEDLVDQHDGPDRKTGLIRAAEGGDMKALRFYVSRQADTEADDRFGRTAIHYVAEQGNVEGVKILVETGADVARVDGTGKSPLAYAQSQLSPDLRIIECLTEALSRPVGVRRTSGRRLWVDAICINQNDVPERNAQLAIISQIYTQAAAVIAWLGVEDEYTTHASESLQIGGETEHLAINELLNIPRYGNITSHTLSPQCRGIINLVNRTWFQRVWVVQEAALARRIRMFCGKHELNYVEVFHLLQCYLGPSSTTAFDPSIRSNIGSTEGYVITDIRLRINPDGEDRAFVERQGGNRRLDYFRRGRLTLPLLMSRAWTLKVTDPRDKVFALLGLAQEPTESISRVVADYSQPVEDVFASTARLFLLGSSEALGLWQTGEQERLEPLEGLSYVQRLPRGNPWASSYLDRLPSWVPDFNAPLFTRRFWCTHFNAGASIKSPDHHPLQPSSNSRTYTVTGILVDEVQAVQNNPADPMGMGYNPCDWLDFIMPLAPIYPTGENRTEALCHTLMANNTWRNTEEEEEEGRDEQARLGFRAFFLRSLCFYLKTPRVVEHVKQLRATDPSDSLPSTEELQAHFRRLEAESKSKPKDGAYWPDTGHSSFEKRWGYHHSGRGLFRTQRGLLGLGLYRAQPGDQVWVVAGCRTPLVLRPVPGSKESTAVLVGEAYVHGIMNGEVQEDEERRVQPVVLV